MPDRFDAEVAAVLTAAGWFPHRDRHDVANDVIGIVEDRVPFDDVHLEAFELAETVLREFVDVCVIQDGAGTELRRRPFLIDPTQVASSVRTLTDFATVLNTRLFPLGMEGDHDAILAIAENGHVFAIDHAGEWHLGNTMDQAITTLVSGTQPARVRADGSW